MGKALIIAEKPSVAADIARVLGGFTKHEDYFESDQFVLSSAVGHLLELTVPEEFEVKRGKWSFANLPMIPPHFALRPIEKSEARLKTLVRLLKRKDVDSLINACDAGREGELIFRYIIQHAKSDKKIQRLWLQSMTPNSIREGFKELRADETMRPLADAAVCRSESDWLVGINGTRAMTAFNSKSGGFQLTTVGRVQTPTLAIVVEREEKIKRFISRDYWEVHATFGAQAGSYTGRWFDEKFAREKNGDAEQKPERIWEVSSAQALHDKCLGKKGIVTEESKPSSQLSPLLFDLTSLQREANNRFHFSAKRTLQLAQTLYERHKALTYPRTDSRALPEDYLDTVRQTLAVLSDTQYSQFAGEILKNSWVQPNKRIFNNAKISDHFAIIPTSIPPKNLEGEEAALYDFVTRRFLSVFYPAAEFQLTTRITRVENEPFKSEGKVMVRPGWLTVYGKEAESENTPSLAPVKPGETVDTTHIEVAACQTKPPARYTEATLLSAMEGAGKLVDDEELREAMSAKGLGTPATRAATIEGLLSEEYMLRQGRELIPTPKAFSLMTLLRGLGIPELCSPELTGNWEFQLRQMERGELQRPEFMSRIAEMTRNIVNKAKGYENETIPGDFAPLKTPCPKCQGVIQENYKKFQCKSCDFALWKSVAGRQFELAEIEELLANKKIGPLQGFRSKMGRPFAAIMKLSPEFKLEFDFGQPGTGADGNPEPVDFSGQEPVGKCPKCGARVFEHGLSYICEKSVETPKACDFRSGKIILQQQIDRAQMSKLLGTGKTDLLNRFISRKNRPFSAFLVVGKDGKVGFEFAPRVRKTPIPKGAKVLNRKSPVEKPPEAGSKP
jgi:DNA topoisomerase-3